MTSITCSKRRYGAVFAGMLAVLLLPAAEPELRDLSAQAGSGANAIRNSGFETGAECWTLDPAHAAIGNFGENGNQGLRLEWSAEERSPVLATQPIHLKPGRIYKLEARNRFLKFDGADNAKIRMRLRSADDSLAVTATIYRHPNGVWRTVGGSVSTIGRSADVEGVLELFFDKNSPGIAEFDDFSLREEAPVWHTYLRTPHRTLVDAGETLDFASTIAGTLPKPPIEPRLICRAEIEYADGKRAGRETPVRDGGFTLAIPPGAPGECKLRFALIDEANHLLLLKSETRLTLSNGNRPAAPKVAVDHAGRVLADGKPFLPVGFFGQTLTDKDLAILKGSPFNTFLPYASLSLRRNPGEQSSPESIRAVLDRAAAQDLKVIFSLKGLYPKIKFSVKEWNQIQDQDQIAEAAVQAFRNHPALLAWYIADELPAGFAPQIEARRRRLNWLDPDHPTLACYNIANALIFMAGSQDIAAVDPYPISTPASNDMLPVVKDVRELDRIFRDRNGNHPGWLVIQAFNKGLYDKRAAKDLELYRREFRDPAEIEMLAMALEGAIAGAKGFLFYSFHDLSRGPDQNQFKRRWPELCRVGAQLRALEPYLLSGKPDPELKYEVVKGSAELRAFTDAEGRIAVLIAAHGPGETLVKIAVNGLPELKSTTGATRREGSEYRFEAVDIGADILK